MPIGRHVGIIAKTGVDDDAGDWASAVVANGGTVSASRLALYDLTISSLKSCGVWATLDHLNIFAAENAISALTDIVGRRLATANGAPTFTADQGYTGSDASSTVFIDTNYNPTGLKFAQNDATWSFWSRTSGQSSAAGFFAFGSRGAGGNGNYLTPRYNTDVAFFEVNAAVANHGGTPTAITDGSGMWLGWRQNSNQQALYRNSILIEEFNETSGAIPNQDIFVLNSNENGAAGTGTGWLGQCAMISFGSKLSERQIEQFYNIMRTHMQAIGAA